MSGPGDRGDGDFYDALPSDPVASMVRGALNEPAIDPEFRQQLRERLVAEANRRASTPPSVLTGPPSRRRLARRLALPAAAVLVAAALLVGTVTALRRAQTKSVEVSASSVPGSISVDPASPVLVHFSQPMDHRSVEAAMQVEPALAVRTSWRGDDLVVTAAHGLAPNTGYLIGFDPSRARTATGVRPKLNPFVAFGTAVVAPTAAPTTPAVLPLDTLAPADDGSEAVIATDGSVLATALRIGTGTSALTRLVGSRVQPLAPATQAICVSRSGHSVAYLGGAGTDTSIVMATGDGLNGRRQPVQVDAGSPLGWIGDGEVSFISAGAVKAVDRAGTVRTLLAGPINAKTDTVTIAPGGRWIFLGAAGGQSGGRVVDLQTGATHILPAAIGAPAFSADGATIYWVDQTSTTPQLAVAPSGAGPVLHIPLPAAAGDQITDLGINADSSLLLYTLHHPDGSAELRLAGLPTGSTLAEAPVAGQSPNWSPTGNDVSILTAGHNGSQIDLVRVPRSVQSDQSAVQQTATAFARAQIVGDADAIHSLSTPAVDPAQLPRPSRFSLLVTRRQSATTWRVELRLVSDPAPTSPIPKAAIETLTIDTAAGRPVVDAASSPSLAAVPAGPHLTAVTPSGGAVVLTFDSDLDPATLAHGIIFTGPGAQTIPVSLRYEPTAKAIIAEGHFEGTTRVELTDQIKDVNGRPAAPVNTVFDAGQTA
ncbi:MAG TPA: hypothetical protein VLL25_11605 [Acidimicrobiales bacterium]|nr:hypothetical protein [Acidimicrobiales bacterium]